MFFYTVFDNFFGFLMKRTVTTFIREKGFKSSDMRFAAERTFSRSAIEAELSFEPFFPNEGLIFTSTENLKHEECT